MIAQFSTPWPRQSYQHVQDVSQAYKKGLMNGVGSFVGILLLFMLSSFVNLPQAMQDGVVHVAAAAVVGYAVLLHTQLFNVLPVLAFLPLFCFCLLTHFVIRTKSKSAANSVPLIQPASNDEGDEVEVETERIEVRHVSRRASLVQGAKLVRTLQSEVKVDSSKSCFSDYSYSSISTSISGLDDDFNLIDINSSVGKSGSSVSWGDDDVAFDYDTEESEEVVNDITCQ
mmetsp:Transcript_33368/g.45722  ORF Transcript_33368/g.45722 Transcript_33368/m.45722 type:complete len:228 (+) Transcript_33368:3464-4147(+)